MSDRQEFLRTRAESLLSGVRFGKFVSVGVVGALCDTTVLVILNDGLGLPFEVATLFGIETAILVMFLINERWTFAGEGSGDRRSLFGRLKRSHLVRLGGSATQFAISVFIYRVLVPADSSLWTAVTTALGLDPALLGGIDLWALVAKGIGVGFAMVVNYVFESLFTWQVHRE